MVPPAAREEEEEEEEEVEGDNKIGKGEGRSWVGSRAEQLEGKPASGAKTCTVTKVYTTEII